MNRTLLIEIDAPADKVWSILAHRFCDVADWTDAVQRSWPLERELVPPDVEIAADAPFPGRMVVTPLGQLAEVLTEYSDEQRVFTFVALGVPGIVGRSADRTTVTELGPSSCRVSLDIEMVLKGPFKVLDPILKSRIGKVLNPFLEDLKHFAETDSVRADRTREASCPPKAS